MRDVHTVVSIGPLRQLSRVPVDGFVLLLLMTVGLAALLPARGAAADVFSVATKVVIVLLFLLYGARLSPMQAWRGARHWRLHLMVLSVTFVVFPLLGLTARVLEPRLLTGELYAASRPACRWRWCCSVRRASA